MKQITRLKRQLSLVQKIAYLQQYMNTIAAAPRRPGKIEAYMKACKRWKVAMRKFYKA